MDSRLEIEGLIKVTCTAILLLFLISACSGGNRKDSLDQPIAFSHKIHAGDYKIACLYCHIYADRSPVAGAPTVKTCMGCHEVIGTDKPGVKKLAEYWEKKEPIEWIKVYDLPDFVRFTHKRHVHAGVRCQTCHGPVETMVKVEKATSLTMGWCLDCHKERKVSIDCFICHH
jgi:hypothetical protein